jgi:hypothetical protein
MQPLRRGRALCLSADFEAFARAQERPRTELAALVHRVPAALDAANVGLHVIDVVRNKIIHGYYLCTPESRRTALIYGDDRTMMIACKTMLLNLFWRQGSSRRSRINSGVTSTIRLLGFAHSFS